MRSLCTAFLLFFCTSLYVWSQQTVIDTILHDGLSRSYILYIPDSYTPGTPAPLVLNFHGYTSNALEQMFYGDFRPIADTAGFLLVHPQGTMDLLGNPHWNVGWGASTVNDVGFTIALIDSLSVMYDINPERIYSTGMSNGGFFSYKLACELSDRIAAIASVTGTMNINQPATCDPQHPMPVMEIHGTADETVQYEGTFFFESVASVLAYWSEFNACDSKAIVEMIEDTDLTDGCSAEHQRYANGTQGVEVEHYKIINGAHTWPGSAFGGVGTNQDIDASTEIWRFFSKYDINGLIATTSTDHDIDDVINVYPNPARTQITIDCVSDKPLRYTLSTMQGKMVKNGFITGATPSISVRELPHGMYLLSADEQIFRIVVTE